MDRKEIQAYKEDERRRELYRDIAKTAILIWGQDEAREQLEWFVKQLLQADVSADDLDNDTLAWVLSCLKDKVPESKKFVLEDFF